MKHEAFLTHFVNRYGIDEDPVTGSAHCELAPYWCEKLGSGALTGYQASRRGGFVKMRLTPEGRVILSGDCVTVIESTLLV